jgi:hypothetical protein
MAYDSRALTGVNCWLAFFVLTLAVFAPLGVLTNRFADLFGSPATAAAFGDRWVVMQAASGSIGAATIALSWYMAWRLMKVQQWQTVRIVIGGLFVIAIVPSLLDIIAVSIIARMPLSRIADLVDVQTVRPLIYAAVWTAYLLRSERVANTYDRYADETELAEVFE